jgi:microcystin-dependent protein
MTTHEQLPAHLERIRFQLVAAAEDLYGPGNLSDVSPWWHRVGAMLARAPRVALAGAGAAVTATAGVALVLATAGAPPAYALTSNGNGSYAITINNITTGIPALNAKLRQLGIDTTAVPVTNTCDAPNDGVSLIGGWSPSTLNETITLDQADIPAGSHGVLAAYQSPSGGIELTIATTADSVPSCLNADDTAAPR